MGEDNTLFTTIIGNILCCSKSRTTLKGNRKDSTAYPTITKVRLILLEQVVKICRRQVHKAPSIDLETSSYI